MRDNIRLGRIAGVPVGVSWGLVAIAVFVVFDYARAVSARYGGYSETVYWAAGVAAAAAYFGSVLAHELGHALAARREGVPVEGITLWLLGGLAKLGHEARTSGAELRIAAAGPAMSALCTAVFWVLSRPLLDDTGLAHMTGQTLAQLFRVNLFLTAFNLLPAAPLDGGRILTAAIWRLSGERTRGQIVAARCGQALGSGMIAVGAYFAFVRRDSFGLAPALIGWFVLESSRQLYKEAASRRVFGDRTVRAAMNPAPPAADERLTVAGFCALVPAATTHGVFPVHGADGRLRGVVTARVLGQVPLANRGLIQIAQLMQPLSVDNAVYADQRLLDALERSPWLRDRAAAVVDASGRVIGSVGPAELAERSARGAPGR